MPKITPTAQVQPTLKAKTNANPSSMREQHAPPTEMPASKDQPGQSETGEAKASEAQPLPPQYEALAKKESALRTRETEFKAREAALESRIQEAVNKALGDYRAKLKQAPLDVLNEEGLTYDQLVEQAVNAPDPKTRALEQKVQSIENNQKKLEEDTRKAADQQRQAAITQIRYDVKDHVDSDPELETIKGVDAYEDVVDLITRTFDESGKLLTVEHASKLVEAELFEEAVKIASLGKVKAKLQPTLTPELVKQAAGSKPQPTTLTNDMTSKRPMSARDRAIARFKGEKF